MDSKAIMEESVPIELWPRLTDEINRTQIDFSCGYTVDIARLDFYDDDTIRAMGTSLGFDSDKIEHIKEDIEGVIGNFGMYVSSPAANRVKNTIVIDDFGGFAYFRFITKGKSILEVRYNGGKLYARDINYDGKTFLSESYDSKGLLGSRLIRDENGHIGPQYDLNANIGLISYYLHGKRISKQEWLLYVEESKKMIKQIPSAVRGVDDLINAYTAF